LNSSLAQFAAELWLAKVFSEGQIMPFLKGFELGPKLGF